MWDRDIFENLRDALASARENLDYPFFRSAVVVPLILRGGVVEIVFELRARTLRRSPGEVAFPGGRVEPGESFWQAARRELEEELGVDRDRVECLGRLPEQQRRRDELVVPFVGRLAEDAQPKADGIEVDEVFSIPLDYLLKNGFGEAELTESYRLSADFPHRYLPEGRRERKATRTVRYLIYGRYLIWGLSANILNQLLKLLR